MIYKKIALTLALIPLICSCAKTPASLCLEDVESYINERPDSALTVLRSMPPLSSAKLEAKKSLLHSMALDKCYIDLQTDSILAPAVAYYSRRGRADDRLKMYYYRARLSENAGDSEGTLEWLVKGERFAGKCLDYPAIGRLYSVKSAQYYKDYLYNESIRNLTIARQYYEKADYKRGIIVSSLDMMTSYICLFDFENARATDIYLESLSDQMTPSQKRRHLIYRLKLAVLDSGDVRSSVDDVYSLNVSMDQELSLAMASAYRALGNPDSSYHYLSLYSGNYDSPVNAHLYELALSEHKALMGDYESAYNLGAKAAVDDAKKFYLRAQKETKFVEERTILAYERKLEHNRFLLAVSLLLLLAMLLILAIRFWKKKIQTIKSDGVRYENLYKAAQKEKASLEEMLHSANCKSDEFNELLKERLIHIENAMVKHKSGLVRDRKAAIEELDSLLEGQSGFLTTLYLLFSVSHTDFINTLRSKNLTTTQIGYCCLYVMGYSGKEVGALVDSKNIYNINAEIRKKLCIDGSPSNLKPYLISLAN